MSANMVAEKAPIHWGDVSGIAMRCRRNTYQSNRGLERRGDARSICGGKSVFKYTEYLEHIIAETEGVKSFAGQSPNALSISRSYLNLRCS